MFICLHRKKIVQGLSEEKEATNHIEAEKLSLSSQLTFLQVSSIAPFFPTANALKIKSTRATNSVDVGA